jgi:hypothetical protein
MRIRCSALGQIGQSNVVKGQKKTPSDCDYQSEGEVLAKV